MRSRTPPLPRRPLYRQAVEVRVLPPGVAVVGLLLKVAVAPLRRVEVKRPQAAAVVLLLRKEEAERRPQLRPRRRNLPTAFT